MSVASLDDISILIAICAMFDNICSVKEMPWSILLVEKSLAGL
jgi:hypothetical protein